MSLLEILRKDKFIWYFAKGFYELPNKWFIEFKDNSDEFWEFIGWERSGCFYENPDNRAEYCSGYKYVTNHKEYAKNKRKYGSTSYMYSSEKESMTKISFSEFKRGMALKKLEKNEKKDSETETK